MTRRVATVAASGVPDCVVDVPDAGWSYATSDTSPGHFDLRLDGLWVGYVVLDDCVEHHSVRMAEIVAGLNHPPPPSGWQGPAAAFRDDVRTGVWPTDRRKYPEAWRARAELLARPTHVIAGAGARATLCGLSNRAGKGPLPQVLARFAAVHVESYGCELCPGCARALAELEEATVDG